MKQYFCTYFDRNYLLKGMALIDSLLLHVGPDLHLTVVCMDELTRLLLPQLYPHNIEVVPIHELEENDAPLRAVKPERSVVEYLWTTTPTQILRILERHPQAERLTYVDADLYFYNSPDAVYRELGDAAVLIHAHRFPERLKALEQNGIYNVGLLTFNNNKQSHEILQWWRERCLEWCGAAVRNGMLGDQGYLNDWPERFPGVVVTQNIGVGAAPWNHEQYQFSHDGSRVLVDQTPLIVYHYHAFSFASPWVVIPAPSETYTPGLTVELLRCCIAPYLNTIHTAIKRVQQLLPTFNFGLNGKQATLSPNHVLVVHRVAHDMAEPMMQATHKKVELDSQWYAYMPTWSQ